MATQFWFVKMGILYWRTSKQSRSRKIIPAGQYATKLLKRRHGIDFRGYAQFYNVLEIPFDSQNEKYVRTYYNELNFRNFDGLYKLRRKLHIP